jgi:transaldolase
MKCASDTIPVVTKAAICIVEALMKEDLSALVLLFSVSKNVSTGRNEVIVMARAIAPFISILYFV